MTILIINENFFVFVESYIYVLIFDLNVKKINHGNIACGLLM